MVRHQAVGVKAEFVFSLGIRDVLYELMVVSFTEEYSLAVVTAAGDVIKTIFAL